MMPFQEYVALMRARGALGIPAVSAHPSQAHPGPVVGVSLPPVLREGIQHLHHELPACDEAFLCLLRFSWQEQSSARFAFPPSGP
jgi:hypothetical protein